MRPRLARAATLVVVITLLGAARAAGAPPQRIVSLAPSITETLFAVGAGERLVGVTDFCDWPPPARAIDRVGSYLRPNVEAIVARRPDLVITVPSPGNQQGVQTLESLGVPVLVVTEGPALRDIFASMERIAGAVERREEGERLVARVRAEVEATRARVAGAPRRRVLVVVGRNPLVAVGEGTLVGELLALAGGDNAASGLGHWPHLSVEFLIRADPDVILDGSMGSEEGGDEWFYRALGLHAAAAGRVHVVRLDEILRPGPRIGPGFERLARFVHPERFE